MQAPVINIINGYDDLLLVVGVSVFALHLSPDVSDHQPATGGGQSDEGDVLEDGEEHSGRMNAYFVAGMAIVSSRPRCCAPTPPSGAATAFQLDDL